MSGEHSHDDLTSGPATNGADGPSRTPEIHRQAGVLRLFGFDRDLNCVRVVEIPRGEEQGRSGSGLIGRPVGEVVPLLAEALLPLFRQVFDEGEPILGMEVTREGSVHGSQRNWRVGLHPIAIDGDVVKEVHLVVEETTEGRRIEEDLRQARDAAEAANRTKSAFLANMSHELRTPMNGVLGMAEILLGTDLSDSQRQFVQIIRSSGEDLLAVLEDILDFSKVEAGKYSLAYEEFGIRERLGQALRALAVRAHSRGLELAYEVAPEVPHHVVGDWQRIRQVLENLVSNAIKFTESGEVHIRVSAEPSEEATVELRFEVRDTGPGIPAEYQASVFEPFVQV
ncbi:histidine kinase dimerization/phospho-acceptor domain-containing protein, partial [Singulisphaera rosea]